ncbi:MAG: acetolactate decarboxylase [Solirubrobacterales bacterium]
MIKSLHVQTMAATDLAGGHDHSALFQSSTVSALLEGRYDGDLTFAQLAERGDTGLGTLNGLDGEMVALDGQFYRADSEGRISAIDPSALTPFAVVVQFDPDLTSSIRSPSDMDTVLEEVTALLESGSSVAAFRIDGSFESVRARSVPAQEKPYRPLAEAIASQNVFEIGPCQGTLIGFRFPDWSEGLEVAGFHLHFIDKDRTRGGHVLAFRILEGTLSAESSSVLEVELPPGVDLASDGLASEVHEAIELAERPT